MLGALVTKLCPTLCNPMDYSPPDSSVHRILQARILEWVAISFSKGIFSTHGSNLHLLHSGRILYHWATREAHIRFMRIKICFIDLTGMLCGWLKPWTGRDFQISVKRPLFFPSWRLYHHFFFFSVFFEQMVWRIRVFPSFILILKLETKPSWFYSFQMLGLNGFSPGRI